MFHNMGLCSRPGGGGNAWKHFGPELDPGMRALHKAPGRRGILERGLRGGGPGRPPFWRTLISPTERWGWTPVSLKNKHSTHTVCFFVLCKRHWFNRVPGAHRGDSLHLPFTLTRTLAMPSYF
jgi:hypothetical protein